MMSAAPLKLRWTAAMIGGAHLPRSSPLHSIPKDDATNVPARIPRPRPDAHHVTTVTVANRTTRRHTAALHGNAVRYAANILFRISRLTHQRRTTCHVTT